MKRLPDEKEPPRENAETAGISSRIPGYFFMFLMVSRALAYLTSEVPSPASTGTSGVIPFPSRSVPVLSTAWNVVV